MSDGKPSSAEIKEISTFGQIEDAEMQKIRKVFDKTIESTWDEMKRNYSVANARKIKDGLENILQSAFEYAKIKRSNIYNIDLAIQSATERERKVIEKDYYYDKHLGDLFDEVIAKTMQKLLQGKVFQSKYTFQLNDFPENELQAIKECLEDINRNTQSLELCMESSS